MRPRETRPSRGPGGSRFQLGPQPQTDLGTRGADSPVSMRGKTRAAGAGGGKPRQPQEARCCPRACPPEPAEPARGHVGRTCRRTRHSGALRKQTRGRRALADVQRPQLGLRAHCGANVFNAPPSGSGAALPRRRDPQSRGPREQGRKSSGRAAADEQQSRGVSPESGAAPRGSSLTQTNGVQIRTESPASLRSPTQIQQILSVAMEMRSFFRKARCSRLLADRQNQCFPFDTTGNRTVEAPTRSAGRHEGPGWTLHAAALLRKTHVRPCGRGLTRGCPPPHANLSQGPPETRGTA